jgi:hypothetical protein
LFFLARCTHFLPLSVLAGRPAEMFALLIYCIIGGYRKKRRICRYPFIKGAAFRYSRRLSLRNRESNLCKKPTIS